MAGNGEMWLLPKFENPDTTFKIRSPRRAHARLKNSGI